MFSNCPHSQNLMVLSINRCDVCLQSVHSWNLMAHGDAREGKWRGNWRMEWVASILHTTSERGVSSITTAHAHTSAASSQLNWRPRRFKWTCPFRWKTKYGFCACAITFQTHSTYWQRSLMLQSSWQWSECSYCLPLRTLYTSLWSNEHCKNTVICR